AARRIRSKHRPTCLICDEPDAALAYVWIGGRAAYLHAACDAIWKHERERQEGDVNRRCLRTVVAALCPRAGGWGDRVGAAAAQLQARETAVSSDRRLTA